MLICFCVPVFESSCTTCFMTVAKENVSEKEIKERLARLKGENPDVQASQNKMVCTRISFIYLLVLLHNVKVPQSRSSRYLFCHNKSLKKNSLCASIYSNVFINLFINEIINLPTKYTWDEIKYFNYVFIDNP